MKKIAKKLAVLIMAMAVVVTGLTITATDVQAAVKTNTYTYDKKKGVCYETAERAQVNTRNCAVFSFYLKNAGDYVASVKPSSSSLITKVTSSTVYTDKDTYTTSPSYYCAAAKDVKFKSLYTIRAFAKETGTYTLDVTIKNSKKKTVCTKTVKVYATEYYGGVQSFAYANTTYTYIDGLNTTKASGKIKVKLNPGYKLKSIEVGSVKNGKFVFSKVSNGKKITLNTVCAYNEDSDPYVDGDYSSQTTYMYDCLKPITPVKISYMDTKLKTTTEYLIYIINVN